MNFDLPIALLLLLAMTGPGTKADPKADFISLATDNLGVTITMSVSPSNPDTFFSFGKELWELNFVGKNGKNYTFEIRYLKDDS